MLEKQDQVLDSNLAGLAALAQEILLLKNIIDLIKEEGKKQTSILSEILSEYKKSRQRQEFNPPFSEPLSPHEVERLLREQNP